MLFRSSWIKKCYCGVNHGQEIKKKLTPQMDDIQQKLFPLLSFIWNLDKLDKRMWHQDTKLPHIRKTHPYFSVCSFKTGGRHCFFPPSVTRDLITWQEWKQRYPECVSLFVEKNTHSPRIVCTLNTTNKDDPCQLPIYTHFLFFCFYWVCTFHTGLF